MSDESKFTLEKSLNTLSRKGVKFDENNKRATVKTGSLGLGLLAQLDYLESVHKYTVFFTK
jgi:hypothetical protein